MSDYIDIVSVACAWNDGTIVLTISLKRSVICCKYWSTPVNKIQFWCFSTSALRNKVYRHQTVLRGDLFQPFLCINRPILFDIFYAEKESKNKTIFPTIYNKAACDMFTCKFLWLKENHSTRMKSSERVCH